MTLNYGKIDHHLMQDIDILRNKLIGRIDFAYCETAKGCSFEELKLLIDDLTDFAALYFKYIKILSDKTSKCNNITSDDIDFIHNISLLKKAYHFENSYVRLNVLSSLINWLSLNSIKRKIHAGTRLPNCHTSLP